MKTITSTEAFVYSKFTKKEVKCIKKIFNKIKKESRKGKQSVQVVFDKFLLSKQEVSNIIWSMNEFRFEVEVSKNERHHSIFKISWNKNLTTSDTIQ